jgi:O-antigen/teichoic acid export membrane protein
VYAQTSAYVLTALIAFSIVMVKASFKRLYWNWPFILMILKKSLPFALMFLLMMSSYRIDPVFIERLLSESTGKIQTGIYAQGYRLFDAFNMIAFLFGTLLLPTFSRLIKQKQSVEVIVRISFSILIIISFIIAITSLIYDKEIITLLYPQVENESQNDYVYRLDISAQVFSILMFGFIAIASNYVFGTLLTANGNLKALNLIAGSGIIVSIILNVLLIPRMMAVGSAIAMLTSQFLMITLQVIVAFKLFRFSVNKKFIRSITGFVISTVVLSFALQFLSSNWIINYLLTLLLTSAFALIFRLINLKEFVLIVKSEN